MIGSIVKCLCGAEPIVEEKDIIGDIAIKKAYKYRCPNCKEKELPWLAQWPHCGAWDDWNQIAPKRSYHRRTLEYNLHGACISPPYKTFEWMDKKKVYEYVKINFYLDNSMYYFCYDYWYKNSGHGFCVSINAKCYPSFEIAKAAAMKEIFRDSKTIRKIVKELLSPKQGELF